MEPLRGEGWGVVRTRSASDAEKVFEFHGDSLNVLIVSEANAEWAQKWNIPYIVLKTTWKDVQVMKHQNSAEQAAFAYLDFDSNFELFKQSIVEARSAPVKRNVKSTGTDFVSVSPIERAASTSVASESSESNDSSFSGIVIQFDQYSNDKIEIESTSKAPASTPAPAAKAQEQEAKVQDQEATRILDSGTSPNILSFLNEDVEAPGASDSVPHESLSAAVEELGGEALPERVEDSTTVFANAEPEADFEQVEFVPEVEEEVSTISQSSLSWQENDSLIPNPPAFSSSIGVDKDVETMKNYLALREQDVMVLTGQMRSAQERVRQLETLLKEERARNAELSQSVQKQDQQIKSFERDKQVEFEVLFNQVEDLNLQIREKTDKVRTFETKLKIMTNEVDQVKERVRVDVRRIRVREKELENQLEILKKDSTALLVARDEKILELKRKIDLLEFNMELVQEQHNKERNVSEQLRQKLKEAAGVMKRAGGLLDQEN